MEWMMLPVVGVLICLVGMCLMMAAVGAIDRRRSKQPGHAGSAETEDLHAAARPHRG
jgi:hypothetical protein